MRSTFLIAAAALAGQSMAGYVLKEDFMDGNFFDHFDFFTGGDPTHGFVQYIDRDTAQNQNMLRGGTGGDAWFGADSTQVVQGNAGRQSIRLSSKKSYTHMLAVINVAQIPIQCGSWPAFWTFGPNWPNQGEIDIIEGVHRQQSNQMTLHTSGGCSAAGQAGGLLQPLAASCEGNNGCGFSEHGANSYSNANAVGGGVWAMEWTSNAINIWWWNDANPAPATVMTDSPDPSGWGPPSMQVPSGDNCNIDQHFLDHNLIFDQTFCGDWAGNQDVWQQSGCASDQYPTCQSYVANNPGAYKDLGFDVKYLKVFQQE